MLNLVEQSYKKLVEFFEVSLMTLNDYLIIFSKDYKKLKIQKNASHFGRHLNSQQLHSAFDNVGSHTSQL